MKRVGWFNRARKYWSVALAAVLGVFGAQAGTVPAGYTQLEYVEAYGHQWVDAQYCPNYNDRLEIKVNFTPGLLGNTQCLWCSRGSGSTDKLTFTAFWIGNSAIRFDHNATNGRPDNTYAATAGEDLVVVADGNALTCTVNGDPAGTMADGAFICGSSLTLLASQTGGMQITPTTAMNNVAYYKLYYFKVYNAKGDLVREYVPVCDEAADNGSTRKFGLYETVSGTFCPNYGSQPLLPGPAAKVVLDADADWRAEGAAALANKAVDLNGHTLRVSALPPTTRITDTSTGERGTLRLDLAESFTNYTAVIDGNLKVVKEGAGELTMSVNAKDTALGGLWNVLGGTLTVDCPFLHIVATDAEPFYVGEGAKFRIPHSSQTSNRLPNNAKVVVEGGELDIGGVNPFNQSALPDFSIKDGVITFRNEVGTEHIKYGNLTLDNSEFHLVGTNTAYSSNAVLQFGTLTTRGNSRIVDVDGSPNSLTQTSGAAFKLNVESGTCELGVKCQLVDLMKTGAGTLVLLDGVKFKVRVGACKKLTVAEGALRPLALPDGDSAFLALQDGTTLDLSAATGPLGGVGAAMANGEAATVTVDCHGRTLAAGETLFTWRNIPTGITFVPVEGGAAISAQPQGLVAGAAEDATVVVEGDAVDLQAPPGTATGGKTLVVGDCTLAADCDWRAYGTIVVTGTMELNGHTLQVAGVTGSGVIQDARFDLTVADATRVQSSSTIYRGVASNLFNNNFTRAVDTTHRIIMEESKLPFICTYDFTDPTVVDSYKVHMGPSDTNDNGKMIGDRAPRAWTFEGSTDGDVWTTLDTRTDEVGWSVWNCRTYAFENSTAYRYYRITVTAPRKADNGYMEFVQLEYGRAGNGSTLVIDVPEGVTTVNFGVRIDGDLRLVKEGAGTYIVGRPYNESFYENSYNRGTEINAGTFVPRFMTSVFGHSDVKLAAGAVLETESYNSATKGLYNYDLAGTLKNSNDVIESGYSTSQAKYAGIALSGDAHIEGRYFYFNDNMETGAGLLALNGHTLYFDLTDYIGFGYWLDDGPGGRIVFSGDNARVETLTGKGPSRTAVDFLGNASIKLKYSLDVGDFHYEAPRWQLNQFAADVCVYGVYRPGAMHPPIILQDGATLDLTAETGTWNADGVVPEASSSTLREYTEPGRLTIADGATVTLDLHGRQLTAGECLVSWNAKPVPQNVTVVFDAETAQSGVVAQIGETGIYYGAAEPRVVDHAVWGGAAHDGNLANPANWTCYDPAGNIIADALPGAATKVKVSGTIDLQIPAGTTVVCREVELGDCVLAGDCDWRGLDTSLLTGNGSIDLHGHKLYVSNLEGEFILRDVSDYQMLDYIESTGQQWINTGYTPACTDRVEMKVRFSKVTSTQCLYCARGTTTTVNTFTCFVINPGNKFRFDRYNNTAGGNVIVASANVDYTVEANGKTLACLINGNNAGSMAPGTFTAGSPFSLFASHTAGTGLNANSAMGNWGFYRLYYFKVYNEAGTLVRDFRPAKRMRDGKVGLLDAVTETFVVRNGSTEFTLGPVQGDALSGDPGELHVDVPEGRTTVNTAVRILRNIKLVKEGEGTFVASCRSQTYTGGNVITAGTATVPVSPSDSDTTYAEKNYYYGASGNPTTVEAGATFDIAGNYDFYLTPFTLDGGTLANTGRDQNQYSWGGIGNVTLTADSRFYFPCATVCNNAGAVIDLGGHTLDVYLAPGKRWTTYNISARNGSINVAPGGIFYPNGTANFETVDLDFEGVGMLLGTTMKVHDLTFGATDEGMLGVYAFEVGGRFLPKTTLFSGCKLLNGSTLDISEQTGPFTLFSPETYGNRTVTFAEEAEITLAFGTRHFKYGDLAVVWDAKPEGVSFVLDRASRRMGYRISVEEDGIHVFRGMTIFVR